MLSPSVPLRSPLQRATIIALLPNKFYGTFYLEILSYLSFYGLMLSTTTSDQPGSPSVSLAGSTHSVGPLCHARQQKSVLDPLSSLHTFPEEVHSAHSMLHTSCPASRIICLPMILNDPYLALKTSVFSNSMHSAAYLPCLHGCLIGLLIFTPTKLLLPVFPYQCQHPHHL